MWHMACKRLSIGKSSGMEPKSWSLGSKLKMGSAPARTPHWQKQDRPSPSVWFWMKASLNAKNFLHAIYSVSPPVTCTLRWFWVYPAWINNRCTSTYTQDRGRSMLLKPVLWLFQGWCRTNSDSSDFSESLGLFYLNTAISGARDCISHTFDDPSYLGMLMIIPHMILSQQESSYLMIVDSCLLVVFTLYSSCSCISMPTSN